MNILVAEDDAATQHSVKSRSGPAMKILVAEDNAVTRHLLKISLERWNYEVVLAKDGTEAMEIVRGEDVPKLAILDWMMPGSDGVEVCRQLRQRTEGSYVYTLLLTSKAEKEDLVSGLGSGADDYLVKPFDLMELQARLRSGQRIIALQDQLIAAREAMREIATHDALTQVWNRGALLESLEREFLRARREHTPMVVLMLDLDHFKHINDTWGHQVGDHVLREVTHRVQSVLRSYDALGRYGGEEFVVIAPGYDPASAGTLAERLLDTVGSRPILTSSGAISVTVSIGLAALAEDSCPESLIKRADEALYWAKNSGRNCWRTG